MNNNSLVQYVKKPLMYLQLVIKPFLFGVLIDLTWYFVIRQFSFSSEKTENFTIIIAVFGAFSAILPAITISRVWDQFDKIQSSILGYMDELNCLENKGALKKIDPDYEKEFKLEINKKIPDLVHVLIGSYSFFTIVATMIIPYNLVETGLFFIFGVAFLHYFVLVVAIELDNVTEGCLQIQGIPDLWKRHIKKKSETAVSKFVRILAHPIHHSFIYFWKDNII